MTRQETQTLGKNAPRWQAMLDGIAMSLAGVCGIHCLLTPLLLIAFPIIGSSFFMNEAFHMWMLIAVLPTTGLAIFLGCRRHKDFPVILLSIGGFILLCIAILNHGHTHNHGNHAGHGWISRESLLTSLGGIVMVSAHIRNFRLCRKANQSGRNDSGCSCHS
ncbi:MAG: MerC domain-containing protein [Opitutales bacterium]|nr:MerC domain-containing protein [Opitutales bacterium]